MDVLLTATMEGVLIRRTGTGPIVGPRERPEEAVGVARPRKATTIPGGAESREPPGRIFIEH